MVSRRALVWVNRLLWTVIVGAVLLLGTVVALGRHYIPYVENYQQQIVDEVQRRTGLHLRVDRISGQWQRLTPQLKIENLRLYNPQKPDEVVLSIDQATLRIGLFRSIDRRTLALKRLEGQGVYVALDEASLGHWRLRGFPGGRGPGVDALLDLLMAMQRAQVRDSRIDMHFFGGGQAHLAGKELTLEQAGNFRRLRLALAFAANGAPLQLTVESRGDPRDRNFSARGYVAFSGVDLTPVLPMVKAYGLDLKHGRIDGSAWLDWRPGGIVELRGALAMPMLDLAALSGRPAPPLRDIKTQFLLRDAGGRRQLWLPEVSGQWGEVALRWRHLLLEADSAHPDVMQLSLPRLALAPIRDALLADTVLPEAAQHALETLAPEGELSNIHVTIPLAPGHWDALRLRAQFSNLSVAALGGAPSVAGANGYVDTGAREGIVDFAGDHFEMGFPHIYHEPLRFDRVLGQVGWRFADGRVHVDSGPLHVQSDAGDASVLLGLDLRVDPHDPVSPQMTLMVGMRDSGAQYRDRFIPYTLKPELLDWLRHSIGGGRLPLGGFIYRGSLAPGEAATEHTLQLFLDVRDGQLSYHPEWPPLHDLQAALWLDDAQLLVESPSARIFDQIETHDVRVEMEPEPVGEWLAVSGEVTGRNDDLLRAVRESALHHQIGAALDGWRWRGPARARLELGIPIGSSRPVAINVDGELEGGQLTLSEQRLTFNDVRGPLLYRSESGLQSPAIKGSLFGKPVAVGLSTGDKGGLNIEAEGRLGMADLQDWLNQPLLSNASGDTDFKLAMRFPSAAQGGQAGLEATSTLKGVTIALPPPYAKSANETLPVTVTMPLTGEKHVDIALGERADLALAWDAKDKMLESAVLRLGRSGRSNALTGQFLVTGTVAEPVELEPWLKLFSQYREPHSGTAGSGAATNETDTDLKLQIRALHLPEVQALGQTLRDVRLFGQRGTGGWVLRVQADRVGGAVTVPEGSGQPWQAHLDYLRLPAPAPTVPGAPPAPSNLLDVDPSRVTPVDLRIDHLWRGDEDWGWVDLQLRPVQNGLSLQQLSGELRGIRFEPRDKQQPVSLTWLRTGDLHRSRFEGRLAADNIGKVLERWGYERVLTAKTGHVDTNVEWIGPPDAISRKILNGEASLEMEDGRFLKASTSATGALKVVGIFNFANLLRRLQLNFSDLFRDGVSFNKVQGGFALDQGVITLVKPLEIESPSSRFRLAGRVDFNTDQADMELVATLPVASNLPWVAALAGGLPAAAGVYVASKLFENQVDKFSSAVYDIKGPWSDPEVKFRRIFDDKTQPGLQAPPAPAKDEGGKP